MLFAQKLNYNGNTISEQKKIYSAEGQESSNMSIAGKIGGGSVKLYQYDELNRLVQYHDASTEATYTYGADNLRAAKTVNGMKTDFVWNGQNLAGETKNGITTAYTYDPTGIALSKTNDEQTRYIKDPHGNVIATSKNNSIAGTYSYTAFGNQLESTDTSNPFRYCGEYYDNESGLTYLRNRYYSSNISRFITEDPVKDGINWYSYCGDNPICYKDSLGLWEDGDENLSSGAQTYIKYYTEKWESAYKDYCTYMANRNEEGAQKVQKAMDFYHAAACDIRDLDSQGRVEGKTLDVPIYNQKDTFPHGDSNNLCWACCHAMITSFYLNDNMDRTLNIASYTNAFLTPLHGTPLTYNGPCYWISTDKLYFGVDKSQTQYYGTLSEDEVRANIQSKNPFAVLYSNFDLSGERLGGHWVLGIGYASAKGHESLVVSNDPFDDKRKPKIQNYTEFQRYGNAIWNETATNDY